MKIIELNGQNYYKLPNNQLVLCEQVLSTDDTKELLSKYYKHEYHNKIAVFEHHNANYSTTYVLGDWMINGCQVVHISKLNDVYNSRSVPVKYINDIDNALGNVLDNTVDLKQFKTTQEIELLILNGYATPLDYISTGIEFNRIFSAIPESMELDFVTKLVEKAVDKKQYIPDSIFVLINCYTRINYDTMLEILKQHEGIHFGTEYFEDKLSEAEKDLYNPNHKLINKTLFEMYKNGVELSHIAKNINDGILPPHDYISSYNDMNEFITLIDKLLPLINNKDILLEHLMDDDDINTMDLIYTVKFFPISELHQTLASYTDEDGFACIIQSFAFLTDEQIRIICDIKANTLDMDYSSMDNAFKILAEKYKK